MTHFTRRIKTKQTRFLLLLMCFFFIEIYIGNTQNKPLDDENALPGQIIVDPQNPAWLKYNGGKHLFICGAGDPEDFLYRGTRNTNGTRNGDQMALIKKMSATGANSIHTIAFRSKNYGGDGADDNNPFIDSEITKKLDENILNQWETWFTEMDKNGIIIYFFIYDDEIKIEAGMNWKLSDTGALHPQEQYFIKTLVEKFKHHKNLIWVVMEGASKIYGHEPHLRKVAEFVKNTDNHNHPVGMSENNKLDFYEYANDENIDVFSLIYYSTDTPHKIHDMLLEAKHIARDRYIVCFTESMKYGIGITMRQKNWAAAMAGAYVMVYQMDIKNTELSDLQDCGRLKNFFEYTDFHLMKSRNDLALGATEYVLANVQDERFQSGIAYSSKTMKTIGIKNVSAGNYNLVWLDCITGKIINQLNFTINSGDASLNKPSVLGQEIALYITKIN